MLLLSLLVVAFKFWWEFDVMSPQCDTAANDMCVVDGMVSRDVMMNVMDVWEGGMCRGGIGGWFLVGFVCVCMFVWMLEWVVVNGLW